VIEYPSDRDSHRDADEHGLPDAVLIRDLTRIVEVLNLKAQGFFSEDSVMAGSMALRCYGTPRFTVFDADFSTTRATLMPGEEMRGKLNYADSELEIDASELRSDDRETLWQSAPISFTPIFSQLVPSQADQQFKADISVRGLVHAGIPMPLEIPYGRPQNLVGRSLWSPRPTRRWTARRVVREPNTASCCLNEPSSATPVLSAITSAGDGALTKRAPVAAAPAMLAINRDDNCAQVLLRRLAAARSSCREFIADLVWNLALVTLE
jgi:hypothetical protein